MFRLEDISENMSGYGNHIIKLTALHSKIWSTAMDKIALYIQTAWPFQLKFEIYIFESMILQIEWKSKFWKIGPAPLTFKKYSVIQRTSVYDMNHKM